MNKISLLIFASIFATDVSVGTALYKIRGDLQMHALDVGQGDAILITTPEQNHILIDGGPDATVLERLGEILPYGFSKIDLLVLTHPHEDHVAGLVSVIDRFEVGAVLLNPVIYESKVYEFFLKKLEGVQIYSANAEQDFRLGYTYLDILFPFESGYEAENSNNGSVVIMLSQYENSKPAYEIFLQGDAEKEEEEKLLNVLSSKTSSNLCAVDSNDCRSPPRVLKAGHHGSRTSSTMELLKKIRPEIMLISCGRGNKFGHPHVETLAGAEEIGAEVLRTDLEGTVSLIFKNGAVEQFRYGLPFL